MSWVGFEPTNPVFEREKTVRALDSAATVIGRGTVVLAKISGEAAKSLCYDQAYSLWCARDSGVEIDLGLSFCNSIRTSYSMPMCPGLFKRSRAQHLLTDRLYWSRGFLIFSVAPGNSIVLPQIWSWLLHFTSFSIHYSLVIQFCVVWNT
jgi:hypothetical protein